MKDQQSEFAAASNLPEKPDPAFTSRLLKAQDDERRRISRELHDSVGQHLVALKMNLGRLRSKLGTKADQEISEAEHMLDDAISEVRNVSHLLHPPNLELLGLRASMLWYTEGFEKRSGIATFAEIPDSLPRLKPEAETALFRVAQECLTNVRRHAQASRVVVKMAADDELLQLQITDNGKGFSNLENCCQGVGILGMQERLNELDGKLRVESGKGSGSSVIATIPLEENRFQQPLTELAREPDRSPESLPSYIPQALGAHPRILVVDDHALTRRGIRSLLESTQEFEVCGEADSVKSAVKQIEELRPDLVILDLRLRDGDGWHVVRQVRRAGLTVNIIIFSHLDSEYIHRSAKNAHCQGALSKGDPPADLVNAVHAVMRGETFFRLSTHSAAAR